MTFSYTRHYCGPVQAVILDWAGTTVDFGCLAPVQAFQETFRAAGVDISRAEARGPMGLDKRAHIQALLQESAIAQRWQAVHGRAPGDADVEALYQDFIPRQVAVVGGRAQLVPGWSSALARLREAGMRIGANTGYGRAMLEPLLAAAADNGYVPDSCVCAEDVVKARPGPGMALLNAVQLAVDSVSACIKVDDTPPGVEEGLAAGMWSIGVAVSGNEVGLDLDEWHSLTEADRQRLRDRARRRLHAAGAHLVVDTVAELPAAAASIAQRLARGEQP